MTADTISISGDLPAFFVSGRKGTSARMIFLHPACTHALGYIQAFQFAASAEGSLLAIQGSNDCGHGMRSWEWDVVKIEQRLNAAFERAGEPDHSGPMTAIGYSQGALMAGALATKYPEKYRRLILIGSPKVVQAQSLSKLDGAVLMAGTFDNRALMKESAVLLERAGVPSTFIEIPNAHHGQLPDGDKIMSEAFVWLDKNSKKAK